MRGVGNAWALACGLAVCIASRSFAADGPPIADAAAIQQAVRDAAQRPPEPAAAVAAALARVKASVEKLETFLATGGAQTQRGWSQWLDLPALQAELARSEPDVAALRSLERRYYENQPGLEKPQFVAVRHDLRGYLTAREYAAAGAPPELYRQRLEELADRLIRLDTDYDEAEAHSAGALVAWLEPLSSEGDALADKIRNHYCRTNAIGRASGRVINMLLEKKVDEQNFITDMVLGSYTQGMAYTSGRVTFGVVPAQQHGSLEIRLNGQIAVPSVVAQRRQISVYSSSQTQLNVQKRMILNEEGLVLYPASAWAPTSVQLQDVVAPSRIVERLATRRVIRMLPQAEAATSQRAGAEARTKLDEQAGAMLSGVNETFRDKMRGPLIRANAMPEILRFFTDTTHLRVALSQYNDGQLAPASPAPQFPTNYDLGCAAHESMINNFLGVLLKGTTTHDEGWLEMMQLMTGASPRPLWVHERAPRWSATFAEERPVIAHFDDDRVGFTLRLTKATHGEREWEHPVEIEGRFKPVVIDGNPVLAREGDVEIRIASGLPAEEEADLRAFLGRKFGAVFQSELHFDGFSPPAGGTIGRLRRLQLVEFRADRGWFTLAYTLPEPQVVSTTRP